jgi:beta-galactosidase
VSESAGTVAWTVDVRNQSSQYLPVEVVGELTGPGLATSIVLSAPGVAIAPGGTRKISRRMPPVKSPRLWSPDEPNLYRLSFRLRVDGRTVDAQVCPLGFRWFRFDPDKGFFLNGKHLKLKGVNRHDDYPGLGWALPKSRQIADMKLIKQLGANFVRTAHYAQHPVVLETCDRLGLLVWEEVPFDGEGPWRPTFRGAKGFAKTLKTNLRETLLRDRNHPCIILWGLGNENLDSGRKSEDRKAVVDLTRELKAIVKKMDPTRPTVLAINKISKGEKSGLVNVPDVVAYNFYFGWYSRDFDSFRKAVDQFHERHPDKSLIISEYGAGSEKGRHTTKPSRQDFSEEYACMFHEAYWDVIAARPFVAGSLVWNVFDFAVERRHRIKKQSVPHMNQKGLFTYDRKPKDVYYYYLSQWTTEPMAYIVSHTWTEREKGVTPIRVYSNGETVELFLGGKSLGVKRAGEKFLWSVPLAAGTNELRAEARRDGKKVVDELKIQCK